MSHQEDKTEKPAEVEEYTEEEVADDVEEVVSEAAVKRVKAPEVWREVLKTSSGRDKAFVSLSYPLNTLRLIASLENLAIYLTGLPAIP